MLTFHELKRRKIVQWALAYLAGAWLLAEVASHLADTWNLPDIFIQGLHVVLAVGLVAALVLAWYHGEQGRQRVSGPELLMLAGIFLIGGVQVQLGDSVAADRTLEASRDRTFSVIEPDRGYSDLVTAAVADNPEEVARALADYVDEGGRDARSIRRDPVFDRVRHHPAFEAELRRLDMILDRQRRQVERDLAADG